MLKLIIGEIRQNFQMLLMMLVFGLVFSMMADRDIFLSNHGSSNSDLGIIFILLNPMISRKQNNNLFLYSLPIKLYQISVSRLIIPILLGLIYFLAFYPIRMALGAVIDSGSILRSAFTFLFLYFILLTFYINIDLRNIFKRKALAVLIGITLPLLAFILFFILFLDNTDNLFLCGLSGIPSIIILVSISLFTFMKRKSYVR